MYKKVFLIFAILILFTTSIFASKPAETEWGIQYKMNPRNPSQGDYVSLKIYSYSTDLDGSNISYVLNGNLIASGLGKKNIVFQVPKSNKELKLEIVSLDFKGKVDKRNIVIKPVSVDLIYEVVNPYRPVFYKGKSVATSQSEVKFFAFPDFINSNGRALDPKSLIYSWKVNGNPMPSSSGLGRNTLSIDKINGTPRDTKVEVKVSSLDRTMVAVRSSILKPKFTKIDFYIDDKIMPFRFKSVANPDLISSYLDSDIVAIPYFFNDIKMSKIDWVINGTKINLLSNGDPLKMNIIKNEKNVDIKLKVKLTVSNNNRILQSGNSSVNFKASDILIQNNKRIIEEKKKQEEINNSNTNFFGL